MSKLIMEIREKVLPPHAVGATPKEVALAVLRYRQGKMKLLAVRR